MIILGLGLVKIRGTPFSWRGLSVKLQHSGRFDPVREQSRTDPSLLEQHTQGSNAQHSARALVLPARSWCDWPSTLTASHGWILSHIVRCGTLPCREKTQRVLPQTRHLFQREKGSDFSWHNLQKWHPVKTPWPYLKQTEWADPFLFSSSNIKQ